MEAGWRGAHRKGTALGGGGLDTHFREDAVIGHEKRALTMGGY